MKVSNIIVLTFTLLISSSAFSQQLSPSIHSVDFTNFTYPWTTGLTIRGGTETFSLRNGKRPEIRDTRGHVDEIGVYLEQVSYGDVTGDGIEEAIIFMSILTGASAMPGQVYIYTLRGNHPKLLWHFYTGDRAENGYRKVYADEGNLVVELNGPKRIGEGLCCPVRFTRTRYQWRGGRFRQKGRKEITPILVPDLKYVMTEGDKVNGLGRVELYVGGRLLHLMPITKNAKHYCVVPIGV